MRTSGCFYPRLFSGRFGGFTGEWKMAAEPEPSATPLHRARSAGGQAGAISLDYKLLHTERSREKRRIKLFDR